MTMKYEEFIADREVKLFEAVNTLSDKEMLFVRELLQKNRTYVKKNKPFSIAQKLAIFSKGEISYVEGFIAINGKNEWSAWNLYKGKALDLTNNKEATYVGIVIPYSLVKKHFVEQLVSILHSYYPLYLNYRKEVNEFERTRRSK